MFKLGRIGVDSSGSSLVWTVALTVTIIDANVVVSGESCHGVGCGPYSSAHTMTGIGTGGGVTT